LHYRFHHAHLQYIQNGKHIYKLMVNKANLNFCSQALTIFFVRSKYQEFTLFSLIIK